LRYEKNNFGSGIILQFFPSSVQVLLKICSKLLKICLKSVPYPRQECGWACGLGRLVPRHANVMYWYPWV
jgi:hypothetical protein